MPPPATQVLGSLPLSPVERCADGRLLTPAVQRNADPIGDALAGLLSPGASVLEIGSGTGEHLVRFASRFPDVDWQPSDVDEDRLLSIDAWRAYAARPNLRPPLTLDATTVWRLGKRRYDLVLAINVLHMLSLAAIEGLLGEARRVLLPEGRVVLYGPWRRGDQYFSEGNRRFDDTLRRSHPSLGLRDIGEVDGQAMSQGLRLLRCVAMPAHNHLLVFQAQPTLPERP